MHPPAPQLLGLHPLSWMASPIRANLRVGTIPLEGSPAWCAPSSTPVTKGRGLEGALRCGLQPHQRKANQNGPTLSWRALPTPFITSRTRSSEYQDVTGCGNTKSLANRPLGAASDHRVEALLGPELGIDGFRFDLGIPSPAAEKNICCR